MNRRDFLKVLGPGVVSALTATPFTEAGEPAKPNLNVLLFTADDLNCDSVGCFGDMMEEASKSYFGEPVCETIVAGDINGDCKVDFKDFALLAYHWAGR
jgi:hypothetical protein